MIDWVGRCERTPSPNATCPPTPPTRTSRTRSHRSQDKGAARQASQVLAALAHLAPDLVLVRLPACLPAFLPFFLSFFLSFFPAPCLPPCCAPAPRRPLRRVCCRPGRPPPNPPPNLPPPPRAHTAARAPPLCGSTGDGHSRGAALLCHPGARACVVCVRVCVCVPAHVVGGRVGCDARMWWVGGCSVTRACGGWEGGV